MPRGSKLQKRAAQMLAVGLILSFNSVWAAPSSEPQTKVTTSLTSAPLEETQPARADTTPLPGASRLVTLHSQQRGPGGFHEETRFEFEVYNTPTVVSYTLPSFAVSFPIPVSPGFQPKTLPGQVQTNSRVTRTTVTEALGWSLGKSWTLDVEIPYSTASFKGFAGDVFGQPSLTVNNLAVEGSPPNRATVDFGASPGRPVAEDADLSHLGDIEVYPRWQAFKRANDSLSVDFSLRLPTGKSQLSPSEQLLVSSLGAASLDVYDPYFGKGLDVGARANWEHKLSSSRDLTFGLGYTVTGEYNQTKWPEGTLENFFNAEANALFNGSTLASSLPPPASQYLTKADKVTVTTRDPANQLFGSAAYTLRPSARRRDQVAVSVIRYDGETVRNPIAILASGVDPNENLFGNDAGGEYSLAKDPSYQASYTHDQLLKRNLFGRLRFSFQRQGTSDVLPPDGVLVRGVQFGDRWSGDLQFLESLDTPGRLLNYGLRSNNIAKAAAPILPEGILNSSRHELSAYLGIEQQTGTWRMGGQVRAGLTDDAPSLILQASVRKDF